MAHTRELEALKEDVKQQAKELKRTSVPRVVIQSVSAVLIAASGGGVAQWRASDTVESAKAETEQYQGMIIGIAHSVSIELERANQELERTRMQLDLCRGIENGSRTATP